MGAYYAIDRRRRQRGGNAARRYRRSSSGGIEPGDEHYEKAVAELKALAKSDGSMLDPAIA